MNDLMCSCVVLNFNDAETTIRLVNKISVYSCINKIIVVDNCSTDDSWKALSVFQNNDRVITIRSDQNGGYGFGNNVGVRYAYHQLKESTVLIANPDVDFSEECLYACIRALKREPDRAVISPVQLDAQGSRVRQYAWNLESGLKMLLHSEFFMRHSLFPLPRASVDFSKEEVLVDCVPGSFLLIDAEKFLAVGGYDEDMFLYYEETSLGSRLHRAGWKTFLLPQETYTHLHSVSVSKSIPKVVAQRRIQNESLLVYLKTECGYGVIRQKLAGGFLTICLIEEKILAKLKNQNKV